MSDVSFTVDALKGRFANQVGRARSLLVQFDQLYTADGGRGAPTTSQADVLRAAVVLLHAALEDLARSTEELFLPPRGSTESLDEVGFPLGGKRGVEKISLGTLRARFPGMSVEQVTAVCVRSRCERASYNDIGQFLRAFADSGVDVDFGRLLEPLGSLTARRHQIAHRADWIRYDDSSPNWKVRTLPRRQVERWADAVDSAGAAAFAAFDRLLIESDHADPT